MQCSQLGIRLWVRIACHEKIAPATVRSSVMAFYLYAMMLSLALLMAPSMGSSFVPKVSSSERYQRGRFRLPVLVLMIRGGSNNDALSKPGNDSAVPLSNSLIAPTISESPPDVSFPAETLETENLVSPLTNPVDVSEEAVLRRSFLGPNASSPGILRRKFPDFPWHLVPNWLTFFRCLAIPLFVGVFYLPHSNVAASGLFAVASATDFLDGYLARKWDVTSAFGAFLDPVVSTAFVLAAYPY
jgi:CDP-alcohol phosphatidyltransferase